MLETDFNLEFKLDVYCQVCYVLWLQLPESVDALVGMSVVAVLSVP